MLLFFTKVAHAETRTLDNPLSGVSDIPELLAAIVNVLLVIAVPIVVFFLIYAGFNYVTAQGNPEKIKTASRSILYALIGAVIVFGAFAISSILQNIVNEF